MGALGFWIWFRSEIADRPETKVYRWDHSCQMQQTHVTTTVLYESAYNCAIHAGAEKKQTYPRISQRDPATTMSLVTSGSNHCKRRRRDLKVLVPYSKDAGILCFSLPSIYPSPFVLYMICDPVGPPQWTTFRSYLRLCTGATRRSVPRSRDGTRSPHGALRQVATDRSKPDKAKDFQATM